MQMQCGAKVGTLATGVRIIRGEGISGLYNGVGLMQMRT